jgi:hypothetical protein
MAKSHQRGWVVEREKKWYGYHRKIVPDPITNEKKTDVLSVILGLKSQLTKRRGLRGTAKRNSKADGAESWRQDHEGRLGHFWLVRP